MCASLKHHKTNREKKILWLIRNFDFWKNYEYFNNQAKKKLFLLMREAKLFSDTTYWMDARIDSMILEAKTRMNKNVPN